MKNVTVSMDEELLRTTRIEAAKAGVSVSRFVSQTVKEKLDELSSSEQGTRRNLQLEAIQRFLSGPKWDVKIDGRMPTAEERNARR